MAAYMSTSSKPFGLDQIDPTELETGLNALMSAYQSSRSAMRAWLVVRYAEALWRHPEIDGGEEARCAYGRLAQHWRWLAGAASETNADGELA